MYKLLVLDGDTWNYTNKWLAKNVHLNLENIVITIKHLQFNQILALNNPKGVDIPFNY